MFKLLILGEALPFLPLEDYTVPQSSKVSPNWNTNYPGHTHDGDNKRSTPPKILSIPSPFLSIPPLPPRRKNHRINKH
jgi:hypothetical protein